MPGWLVKKDKWVRVFEIKTKSEKSDELGFPKYDNLIREIMAAAKEGGGWMLFKDGDVVFASKARNVKMLFKARDGKARGREHHG